MRLAKRSIRHQLRVVLVLLLVLVPLVGGASLVTLASQGRAVRVLTLSMGPAQDASVEIRQLMTEASGQLNLSLAGALLSRPAATYRPQVEDKVEVLRRSVGYPELPAATRERLATLLADEEATIAAWFSAAARAEASRSGPLSAQGEAQDTADRAFRSFLGANRSLGSVINTERDALRRASRGATALQVGVTVGVAAVAVLLVFLVVRLLTGSITEPLGRLREVVHRQRDGDRTALADTGWGAEEVRSLAEDFNGLTRANQILQEQQASVLLSHQLSLDVARVVHGAPAVDTAMYSVCAMLGEGLAADRVLLYTHDESGRIDERTQWHRYDLPDLPPLPPSLAQAVQEVNEQLRRQATFIAVPDFLAPEVQEQDRAQGFYRATGAHSLLMVPVGVGERGLGVLAVLMVDAPRRWRRHEIQSAQQCAGYVAQSIASLQLREMQDEQVHQLTEIDRQKTDFMATVSHELRTPLTSIAGYLEMLEDGDYGDLTQPQLDALATIERNALRLRGMIEDLLVLNRIEASGLQPSLEEVPVGRLLGDVVEVLMPTAAMAEVDLQMAPVDPSMVIAVDPRHMERTFINLGSNAVKFTPAGGRVEVTAEREDGGVVVTVADSGIGIPDADQANLFQRFFRARNAADAAIPGTGLGLAIARSIVEGHGGRLTLESQEGQGTTIRVWLPLVDPVREGNAEQPLTV